MEALGLNLSGKDLPRYLLEPPRDENLIKFHRILIKDIMLRVYCNMYITNGV